MSPETMYLSAITILELETGVLAMERRDPVQGGRAKAMVGGEGAARVRGAHNSF